MGQNNVVGFTHPLAKYNESISIYNAPYIYDKELYIDTIANEAGYLVIVEERHDLFLKIRMIDDSTFVKWVRVGDIGVSIQNYDLKEIPVYSKASNNSPLITCLYSSYIGLIYDIMDCYVCLEIIDPNNSWQTTHVIGWIKSSYLCGDPYTTCTAPDDFNKCEDILEMPDYISMTDSVLVWLQNKYNKNVEIAKMRNEYIFDILASPDCSIFLNKIFKQGKKIQYNFYKELKYPLHDVINIKQCINNVNNSDILSHRKRKIINALKKTYKK